MNESDNMFEEEYLTCERRHIFFVLMGVAGFFGAFTYSIRGGISVMHRPPISFYLQWHSATPSGNTPSTF